MIKIVRAKLHGIRVTDADLNYHGSITLDPEQCAKIGIFPLEFVEIWNKNNGARISTYVIFGEAGSKCCVLNGSAARSCEIGDELIIAASSYVKPEELYKIKPRFLTFNSDNSIDQVMAYNVFKNDEFDFNFEVIENAEK